MKWGTHVTEFSLSLPDNRVYCPGDTVTGELRLSTDAPVECRGLHIRLEHKSVVHWTELEIDDSADSGRPTMTRVHYHGEQVRECSAATKMRILCVF